MPSTFNGVSGSGLSVEAEGLRGPSVRLNL